MIQSDMMTLDETGAATQVTKRLLLVDDERYILNSLQRLLWKEPYEIFTANSAAEALEMLEQLGDTIQLVISDQRMPQMTGIEMFRVIRERWPEVMRIILSGYSEVNTLISAINEELVYRFISKPWNDEEIKLGIRRSLEQQTLMIENKKLSDELVAQNEQLKATNQTFLQRADDCSVSQASYAKIIDLMAIGLMVIGPDGMICSVNQRLAKILAPDTAMWVGSQVKRTTVSSYFTFDMNVLTQQVGTFEAEGKRYQWAMVLIDEAPLKGSRVVTVWEWMGEQ